MMSKDGKAENPSAEILHALVEMRGLGRAYARYPDIVTTAFERGRRPIGSFPENFSALTEPAGRFVAPTEKSE
jgi:hypothetical protein